MVRDFEDLIVWQKSISLAREIYLLSRKFPDDERYGLTSQVRRAAVSISSNIAEGQGRGSPNEFSHFLTIARGSLMEVRSQIHLTISLEFISTEDCKNTDSLTKEVGRLINGLVNSSRTRGESGV